MLSKDAQSRLERLKISVGRSAIEYNEQCQILAEMWKYGDYLEGNNDLKNVNNFSYFSSWLARNDIDFSPGEISDRVKVAHYLIDLGQGEFVKKSSQSKSAAIARHLQQSRQYDDPATQATTQDKENLVRALEDIVKNQVPLALIGTKLREHHFIPVQPPRNKKGEQGWFEVRSRRLPDRGELYLQTIYLKFQDIDPVTYKDVDAVTFRMAVAYAKANLNWEEIEKEVAEAANQRLGLSLAA